MKLVLAESRFLKEPITIISELVNEARFKINKDSIELVAMDPANVAMVIFKLLSSAFVEYNVKEEREIALNIEHLKEILRRAKASDTLSLELPEKENRLKIVIKGDAIKTFNINLINIQEGEHKIPNLKFPVKVETNALILDEAIEDMDIISDAINFITESKKFVIDAEGNLSNAKIEINQDEETKITGTNVRAKYAIEYLKKMIKAGKLSNNVVLQFDKDYPLKLDFIVKDKLQLSFVLAPRVQND